MKSPLTCLLLFCFLLAGKAQTRQAVSYFPLQDIKLLESPFFTGTADRLALYHGYES